MIKLGKNHHYFLYCQGKPYGSAWVDPIANDEEAGLFHIEITKFGPSVFNRMMRDADTLFDYISVDYSRLLAIVRQQDVAHGDIHLWKKFVRIFGFEEPMYMTYREI